MNRAPTLRIDRLIWSMTVWAGIAVLIAVHRYITGWLGSPGAFLPALLDNLHYVFIWALATPFILYSVERFPISGGDWMTNAFLHIGFGLAFLIVLNLVGATWNQVLGRSPVDLSTAFRSGSENFLLLLPFGLSVYGAVVGVGHVIRSRSESGAHASATQTAVTKAPTEDGRLPVTEQYRTYLVDVDAITHIEADRHHVLIHTREKTYRPRMRFSDVLRRVSGSGIVRIHRSHAVHRDAVAEVQTYMYGDCMIILQDGTRLRMSRTYREAAEPELGVAVD